MSRCVVGARARARARGREGGREGGREREGARGGGLLFFGVATEMQASSLLRLLTSVRARHSAADLPMADEGSP